MSGMFTFFAKMPVGQSRRESDTVCEVFLVGLTTVPVRRYLPVGASAAELQEFGFRHTSAWSWSRSRRNSRSPGVCSFYTRIPPARGAHLSSDAPRVRA